MRPLPLATALLTMSAPRERFFKAVDDGNVEGVRKWLDIGMPVGVLDIGLTFSRRIHKEDPAYVARENKQAGRMPGATALHYAVKHQHADMVKLLLARGADPGLVDNQLPRGKPPLQVLAESVVQTPWLDWERVLDVASLLLDAGATFEPEDEELVGVVLAMEKSGMTDRFLGMLSNKQAKHLDQATAQPVLRQARPRRM